MVTTSSLRFSKTFLPSTSSITRSVWLLVNIGRVVSGSLPSPKSIQNCIPWYPRMSHDELVHLLQGGGARLTLSRSYTLLFSILTAARRSTMPVSFSGRIRESSQFSSPLEAVVMRRFSSKPYSQPLWMAVTIWTSRMILVDGIIHTLCGFACYSEYRQC